MSSIPDNIDAATPIAVPTHPFIQTTGADAILRSRDGADFYVHRGILSLVSPVFETMFTLPQPQPTSAVPIIDMQEDATNLDRALRFFYPATQPRVASLDELQRIIEILVSKYDMQCVVPAAKQYLERYTVSHPLGVYAVAFANGWEDVARVAAKECLKLPLRVPDAEPPFELKYLTSTAHYNLLRYHFQCAAVAKATTQDLLWIETPRQYCWFGCNSACGSHFQTLSGGNKCRVSTWFAQFIAQMGDILATSPIIDFRNDSVFSNAIGRAVQCDHVCRTHAFDQLSSFLTVWEAKIKEELICSVHRLSGNSDLNASTYYTALRIHCTVPLTL